ncbi:fumarylacetoacetate hydrolase family protein [Rhodoplanes sp. Z2-YC6860]|uniref:fumarylacetoacetate hydrolase family protein n=1 Tax=Rhodoplanes sp. Z2-YC6860 TaxID=674703 RepID=UPI00078B8BB0|nr:fumarylacetoacetate hydrolase family protein [Rhodoplanes sp. Z2-YC6860]AMN41614.1 fumarylacetoacetate hydrolase family protein [Rhodoplanes sp. Z2-YC6860]
MKLASLKSGRDGQLVVVSRDLTRSADASVVARTFREALDDWSAAEPRLQEIADSLEAGRIAHAPFDPKKCAAPLPRSFGWADGSAYVNHVALVRKSRGAEVPATFWTDPLMYRGASDQFIGPTDPIKAADTAWGIDLEGEVAVVVTDVPQGATPAQTQPLIKLFMLVNDISLRNLIPNELAKGFGFLQSKGQTAFSPVAVTPDELGKAFDGKRVHLPLLSSINGKPFGRPDAGVDMTFDFPTLVSHAVKTRPLMGGAIIGSGTVSNRDADGGPGRPVPDGGVGYSCLAEIRTVETILHGAPKTPYLNFGDRVRIEMNDAQGRSIFGAIDHEVVRV